MNQSDPFTVCAAFSPEGKSLESALDIALRSVSLFKDKHGFLDYEIIKPQQDHNPVMLIVHWKDASAFGDAMRSFDILTFHESLDDEVSETLYSEAEIIRSR